MTRFPTDLVTVYEAPDPLSAEAIAMVLREAKIEVFVIRPPSPGLGPIVPEASKRVPVRVHSADLAAAQRVLRTNVEESADIDWDEVASEAGGPIGDDHSGLFRPARRQRMPLLAVAGWLLAASIILLLLFTVALMLVKQLSGSRPDAKVVALPAPAGSFN